MTIKLTFLCLVALMMGLVNAEDPTSERRSPTTAATNTRSSGQSPRFQISLYEALEAKTLREGDRLTLDCSITGYPTPGYTWYKDGVELSSGDRRYTIRQVDWGSRLRLPNIQVPDSGEYSCKALNRAGERNTSATITVLRVARPATTTSRDRGQPQPTQSDEDDIEKPFCQEYKGEYCHYLKANEIYVTSRRAQTDGELSVIALVKQLDDMNVPLTSECFKKSVEAACYDRMPICAVRPSPLTPVPRRLCKQECIALYQLCKSYFPDDATSWRLLPTCSPLDNSAGCVRIGDTTKTEQHEVTSSANTKAPPAGITSLLVQVALPIFIAVLLVIAIVVLAVCISRKRGKLQGGNSVPSSNGSHAKSAELSSLSDRAAPAFIKDVSLDNINMLQELGESSYGKVYHGQVFGLYGNNTASAVFIKCLHEKATNDQHSEFRQEIAVMSEIRHQHIVSLLGISTKGLTHCLLYEHLQLGDLRQFLQCQQSRGSSLTSKELMYVVTQIASALEYLANAHFIHKDIAAHNVIVSQNLNVKLSNLNIVHGVHSSNYCHLHNKMLPIRWLPPESITYNRFSLETDIYSYGVLLWESFSGAQQPYAGFTNQEVIEMVRSRQLLSCPNSCPPKIYSLMMECWHETPNKRPTAKEVHQKMRAWYLDNSYALSTTTGPSVSASGSTCTAPSHHSSTGLPASNINANSNHTNLTDIPGSRGAIDDVLRPGYLKQEDAAPYYSTIDSSFNGNGIHTPSSSSFDNASEYTESTNQPLQSPTNNMLPPNYYTSTPTHRYASLNRRRNDADFGTQTTPLFQQTDQV